jgi:Monooxygenase af470-like
MAEAPTRTTVDLSAYPDLVVIYLGMRVEEPRGLETLETLGPQIQATVEEQPDGLLLHERLVYGDDPPHIGMRQYWRDFDSLRAWSLTLPHKQWWTDYLRDRGGTSFWHETYFRRGGLESIYVDVDPGVGMTQFAPTRSVTGPMLGALARADADRSQAGASA